MLAWPENLPPLANLSARFRSSSGGGSGIIADRRRSFPAARRRLDRLLPDGGFCRGTLVEWLSAGEGSGAATLALAIACRTCREAAALVVVDRPRKFYPPAAAGLAIDWKWFAVVRPRNDRDETWALDQILRSPGVGSVVCWPQKLTERRFRQMQLAAEAGGTLCWLVRPEQAREEPSWAEMRLLIACQGSLAASFTTRVMARSPDRAMSSTEGLPEYRRPSVSGVTRSGDRATTSLRRRLRIEMLHLRGGRAGGSVELELDEQTGALYEPRAVDLAPRLAAPAAGRRSVGA